MAILWEALNGLKHGGECMVQGRLKAGYHTVEIKITKKSMVENLGYSKSTVAGLGIKPISFIYEGYIGDGFKEEIKPPEKEYEGKGFILELPPQAVKPSEEEFKAVISQPLKIEVLKAIKLKQDEMIIEVKPQQPSEFYITSVIPHPEENLHNLELS